MSTNSTKYNGTLRLNSVTNDDTITNLLVIDTAVIVSPKKIQTRAISSLPGANQSINTTDNVTFNQITSFQDLAQSNGTMTLVMDNISIAQAKITTLTTTATTIYSLSTVTGKSYTIYAEVSMISASSTNVLGDASFIMTRRVTNTAGVLDIGTVETFMSRQGNSGTANVQFVSSGATLNIQVVGIAATSNYWTFFLRIIRSP